MRAPAADAATDALRRVSLAFAGLDDTIIARVCGALALDAVKACRAVLADRDTRAALARVFAGGIEIYAGDDGAPRWRPRAPAGGARPDGGA